MEEGALVSQRLGSERVPAGVAFAEFAEVSRRAGERGGEELQPDPAGGRAVDLDV